MTTKITFPQYQPQYYYKKPMSEMEPFEVCIIDDTDRPPFNGTVVMRTANTDKFEVMNMTDPEEDSCWDNSECTLMVRPYYGPILIQRS